MANSTSTQITYILKKQIKTSSPLGLIFTLKFEELNISTKKVNPNKNLIIKSLWDKVESSSPPAFYSVTNFFFINSKNLKLGNAVITNSYKIRVQDVPSFEDSFELLKKTVYRNLPASGPVVQSFLANTYNFEGEDGTLSNIKFHNNVSNNTPSGNLKGNLKGNFCTVVLYNTKCDCSCYC